jgi:hypothetical protein
MKRFHVHVHVDDLAQSVRFYSTLFAADPTVLKDDYAKWMLDDPRVNFAISTHADAAVGISHLGIQAENEAELAMSYASPVPSGRSSRRPDLLLRRSDSCGSPTRRSEAGDVLHHGDMTVYGSAFGKLRR